MGNIPILRTINRVPGGLMVVFLVLGCLTNTFAPASLQIGSFTTALFKNGALPLIAVLLFCSGSQITIRTAGVALWKGIVLNFAKVVSGLVIGVAVGKILGPEGTLWGLTPLAFVSAMSNSNGGLYTALATKYGDNSDVGAIAVISSNDGPFFEMAAMGMAGLANIPWIALLAVVLPIIIGMVLGNLDHEIKKFLAPGALLSIPFFAFPLGAGLDLHQLLEAGVPGIILGLLTVFVTGTTGFFLYKWFIPKKDRKNDAVGAAVGTTAGNAAATPAAFASVDPSFVPQVGAATIQVGASIIISALLCPLFVDFLARRQRRREGLSEEVAEKEELKKELGSQL